MSEVFFFFVIFSNCWSEYQCTFSRDSLQRSNVFLNDKTVVNTEHIVYCKDQTSWKKQQNLSKFEVAIRPACAGSSFSMNGKYSDHAAQGYLILLKVLMMNVTSQIFPDRAVCSFTKVSGECFHVVRLRKLI